MEEKTKIDIVKIEFHKDQNEFLKFCNENYEQIRRLKEVGLFYYSKIGAGSVRISWNSSGYFGKLKDFNYPDLSFNDKTFPHP
jgi:hypothetical protein